MKNIYKYSFILLLFSSMIFSYSCKKEDTGAPVVNNIRLTDPAFADKSLDTVGLGKVIAIQGNYLNTTKVVRINGFDVPFNPTYASKENLLIQVPEETPTLATDPLIKNELYIETEHGTITRKLIVLPPAPVVAKISNEFAKEGEKLVIKGKYFFFVQHIKFPGNVIGTDFEVNGDATELKVTVPAGVGIGGVEVVTPSGSGSSAPAYVMNDITGMLCNFDDINPFGAWGPKPVTVDPSTNPTPAALMGKYLLITSGSEIIPGSWWNNDWVMPTSGVKNLELTGDANNYALKFEIYVPEVWNSGWFEMNFGWYNFYRWMEWCDDLDPAAYWDPTTGTRTNLVTTSWQTVSIPLSLFRKKPGSNPDGAPVAKVEEIMGSDIVWAFQNPDTGVAIPNLHICIDNIRIVQIK